MINIAGVVSIVLFYLLILGVGIWAGRKKEEGNDSEEEVMLAGRSIGLFVGIFTMTGKIYKELIRPELDLNSLLSGHFQQHGSVADTSTERRRPFTRQA